MSHNTMPYWSQSKTYITRNHDVVDLLVHRKIGIHDILGAERATYSLRETVMQMHKEGMRCSTRDTL